MTTKTFRGRTLEELLPQIREQLGPDAVITHQREGLVGGVGGFFAKRCIEVEASASGPLLAARALPAQRIFDAYDSGQLEASDEELRSPVIEAMIAQAAPFADMLEQAELRAPQVTEVLDDFEDLAPEPLEEPIDLPDSDTDFEPVQARMCELGLPQAVAEALVREALRGMRPFDQD